MENFKIIDEKENPLFNRKEVRASIEADITPSNADIVKLISEKFSTQPENIKIKKIEGSFGLNNFIIIANIYNSKEDKESIERKSKGEISAEAEINVEAQEQSSQTESFLDNSSNKSEPTGETNE